MLKDPRKKVEEYFLRMDDLVNRSLLLMSWTLKRKREKYLHLSERIGLRNPDQKIRTLRLLILEGRRRLEQNIRYSVEIQREKVRGVFGKLDSLSPLSILQRGYSITRRMPTMEILRDVVHVKEGDKVEVRLYRGSLFCSIEKTEKS
jgi:exodeoxyribonuclease VII large subunit